MYFLGLPKQDISVFAPPPHLLSLASICGKQFRIAMVREKLSHESTTSDFDWNADVSRVQKQGPVV